MNLIQLFAGAVRKARDKEHVFVEELRKKNQSKPYEEDLEFAKNFFDTRTKEYKKLITLETEGATKSEITASLGQIEMCHKYIETVLKKIACNPKPYLETGYFAERSEFSEYIKRYLLTHSTNIDEVEKQLANSPEKPTREEIDAVLLENRKGKANGLFEEMHARETIKSINEELEYNRNLSQDERRTLIVKKYFLSAKYFEAENAVLSSGFYGRYREPSDGASYDSAIMSQLRSGKEEYTEFKNNYWALKVQNEVGEMLRATKVSGVQIYGCISYLTAAKFATVEAFKLAESMRQNSDLNSLLGSRPKALIREFAETKNIEWKN